MTRSVEEDTDLVLWFLGLKDERQWGSARAAQLLGVDQTTVSDWDRRRRRADKAGGHFELTVIEKNRKRLSGFRDLVERLGLEVAELLPEQLARVNALVEMVMDEDLFEPAVTTEDREGAARKMLRGDANHSAMERYFEIQLQQRRAGDGELQRAEGEGNVRNRSGDPAGRRKA